MNINSPNVALNKDSQVSSEFDPKKMWLIEYRIVKKYHDFYHCAWVMNINSPNIASDKYSRVSSEFPKQMWFIECRIVKNIMIFVIVAG